MTANNNKLAMIGNGSCCLLPGPPFQGPFFSRLNNNTYRLNIPVIIEKAGIGVLSIGAIINAGKTFFTIFI